MNTTFPVNTAQTCVNTSMDYDQEPSVDTTFVSNFSDTINCQLSLPVDVDDSVQLKFEVWFGVLRVYLFYYPPPNVRYISISCFQLGKTADLMLDPMQISMLTEFKVVNMDGSDLMKYTKVAIVCGLGYTAFQELKVLRNGRIVKTYPNYAYLAHSQMVLKEDAGYINSVLAGEMGMYLDTEPATDPNFTGNKGEKVFPS